MVPAVPEPARLPEGMKAVYVDLDGVLADFDDAVLQVTGMEPRDQKPGAMWPRLQAVPPPGFFATLHPMPDAAALWAAVAPYQPTILTGLPIGAWAAPQKRVWVAAALGAKVEVITCMAPDKVRYARPGALLIDDAVARQEPWTRAGGTFILHTSAATTLEALRRLGFDAPPPPS